MSEYKPLRLAVFLLSVIGLIDASYLTWVKFTHNETRCLPGVGDCFSVNTSRYSEIMGIPIALIGAGAYVLLILLVLLEGRGAAWREYGQIGEFALALFGSLYSVYLTYLEIAVIKAICPFCVVSGVIMISLLLVSIIRLANSQTQSNSKQEDDYAQN